MGALRALLAEVVRAWRVDRAQGRERRNAARDEAAAEELQRVRDGLTNRFPPGDWGI